ncbi:MAG TPA: inositol monophosphatase [Mycobacteriales bacterium]|nr:inositol monophosphatase [Mycobacteriales bacterium]
MSLTEQELTKLGDQAASVLDEMESVFTAGMGAKPKVEKGPGDYATAVDLELERRIGDALRSRTGFAVAGEELGGADIHSGEPTWLIDPIDGTANYMHSMPLSGINCALISGGVPVVGATWLPMLNQRYLAVAGGPVLCNGEQLPRREPAQLKDVIVGVGNPQTNSERFPRRYRRAVVKRLLDSAFRVRLLGSCALELAWVAGGQFGAAVQFSVHSWDLAPGICLNEAAGVEYTTLDGRPFTLREKSVLCAVPDAAEQLTDIIASLGDPADYV